jgi:hypothetical protein
MHPKWWIITIVAILVLPIVTAEIDIIVNSYEPDNQRTLIQVQNSGDTDLTNVYYTIDNFPKQKLVNLLPKKASNILLEVLSPGEHTIIVESNEESITKTINLGQKEEIVEEVQKNTPKTASQIENNYEAEQQAAANIDIERQKILLEQIRNKNKQELEAKAQQSDQRQQELLQEITQEEEEKSVTTEPKKEIRLPKVKTTQEKPASQKTLLIILAAIILLIIIPALYYFHKMKNERF